MLFAKMEDCCSFAVSALDGVYGWASEAVAIVIFVLVFNFLMKWILKRLHLHFQSQKKILSDSFVRALYTPLSYFVWFFAIVQTLDLIAVRVLHELPVENRHMIIAVGAILAFAWFLMRWKHFVVQYLVSKSKNREITMEQGKIGAIDKLATVLITFFVIFILLETTNHSVNTLIAFGGVGGLALAFASQEIVANFFGGFMIYLTQPFTIGDTILLPDHSIEGTVEEIGWYMTRIRAPDKRPIYIPNSLFTKQIVITPSRMSHRQIKETISIRSEDLAKVKPIVQDLKEMFQQHPDLDHNQPIYARLNAFGQSSVDIEVSVYTLTTDNVGFLKIKEDVLLKIAATIEKQDAQLSTPSQIIMLKQ